MDRRGEGTVLPKRRGIVDKDKINVFLRYGVKVSRSSGQGEMIIDHISLRFILGQNCTNITSVRAMCNSRCVYSRRT